MLYVAVEDRTKKWVIGLHEDESSPHVYNLYNKKKNTIITLPTKQARLETNLNLI